MAKDLIKRVTIRPNDDNSVTIEIEPAPAKKEKDNDDCCSPWGGELTATASSFDAAIDKLKEMYALEIKKGEKPKDILKDYLG